MSESRRVKAIIDLLYFALILALIWLVLRFALPWLAPLVLAFFTAALIEPAVRGLNKKYNFRRWFAATLCTLIFLAAIIALLSVIVWRASYEVSAFIRRLPQLLSGVPGIVASFEEKLSGYINSAPPAVQEYILRVIYSISEKSAELPGILTGRLLSGITGFLSATPGTLLFLFTYMIGVFFISSDFPAIKRFIINQFPQRLRGRVLDMKGNFMFVMVKWFKAQVLLMCITFLQLSFAFFLMRIDIAAILALIVAVIDALPLFGVGTVLIPWAIIAAMGGNIKRAIALIVIYAVVSLARRLLEPKILGVEMGLHPAAMLIAIYIGFSCAGVWGMIGFPIALLVLKEFNDHGYIKLWK